MIKYREKFRFHECHRSTYFIGFALLYQSPNFRAVGPDFLASVCRLSTALNPAVYCLICTMSSEIFSVSLEQEGRYLAETGHSITLSTVQNVGVKMSILVFNCEGHFLKIHLYNSQRESYQRMHSSSPACSLRHVAPTEQTV